MVSRAQSQFLVYLDKFKSLLLTSEGWRIIYVIILLAEAAKLYPGGIWSLLLELKYFLFCETICRSNTDNDCTPSTGQTLSSLLHLKLPFIWIHNLGTHSGKMWECETPQTTEETNLSLPWQSFFHYFRKICLYLIPWSYFWKGNKCECTIEGTWPFWGPTNRSSVPLLQISCAQGNSLILRMLRNCFQRSANAHKNVFWLLVWESGAHFFSLCILHLVLSNQSHNLRGIIPQYASPYFATYNWRMSLRHCKESESCGLLCQSVIYGFLLTKCQRGELIRYWSMQLQTLFSYLKFAINLQRDQSLDKVCYRSAKQDAL